MRRSWAEWVMVFVTLLVLSSRLYFESWSGLMAHLIRGVCLYYVYRIVKGNL